MLLTFTSNLMVAVFVGGVRYQENDLSAGMVTLITKPSYPGPTSDNRPVD